MSSLRRVALVFGCFLSLSSLAYGATDVLHDDFDDGNLATNTGVGGIGTGFTTGWIDCGTGTGVNASEAGGKAIVDGASCVHFMQSKDAIDPTRTTMVWSIDKLPTQPAQGVLVGWVQDGKDACCETGVYLGIEGHRVVLDLQAKSGADPFQWQGRFFDIPAGSTAPNEVYPGGSAGPVTATLSLDENGWQVSVQGSGIDISKSGTYSSCLYPVNGQCIGLADLLNYPGVNGTLRAVAGSGREYQSAEFQSVTVTRRATVCWYDSNGDYTGSGSSLGTVGSIVRGGSGSQSASYLISMDPSACPLLLPAAATSGTTGALVRQDFSNCTNDDVVASPSNTSGSVTLFHTASGPAKAVVRLLDGVSGTSYHFFHKCYSWAGDLTANDAGQGTAVFDLYLGPGPVAFDMYPDGAPLGHKYQSVLMTF